MGALWGRAHKCVGIHFAGMQLEVVLGAVLRMRRETAFQIPK
jgi:cytochrome P450